MKIKQEILDDKRTATKDAIVKTELLDDFLDDFDDEIAAAASERHNSKQPNRERVVTW